MNKIYDESKKELPRHAYFLRPISSTLKVSSAPHALRVSRFTVVVVVVEAHSIYLEYLLLRGRGCS
jgi:hypothetical protein